jgi:hypothetical protein
LQPLDRQWPGRRPDGVVGVEQKYSKVVGLDVGAFVGEFVVAVAVRQT